MLSSYVNSRPTSEVWVLRAWRERHNKTILSTLERSRVFIADIMVKSSTHPLHALTVSTQVVTSFFATVPNYEQQWLHHVSPIMIVHNHYPTLATSTLHSPKPHHHLQQPVKITSHEHYRSDFVFYFCVIFVLVSSFRAKKGIYYVYCKVSRNKGQI